MMLRDRFFEKDEIKENEMTYVEFEEAKKIEQELLFYDTKLKRLKKLKESVNMRVDSLVLTDLTKVHSYIVPPEITDDILDIAVKDIMDKVIPLKKRWNKLVGMEEY